MVLKELILTVSLKVNSYLTEGYGGLEVDC